MASASTADGSETVIPFTARRCASFPDGCSALNGNSLKTLSRQNGSALMLGRWIARAWAVLSVAGFIYLMFAVKTVTPGIVLAAGGDGIAMGIAIFSMTVEGR